MVTNYLVSNFTVTNIQNYLSVKFVISGNNKKF